MLWYIAVSKNDTVIFNTMNSKQRKTLEAMIALPTRSDILWSDITSLFRALGAEISEGSGSRVRVALRGVRAVFHRPHPERETDKGTVKSVVRFLTAAGIYPTEGNNDASS
jgi:HicA toxin of bacterial toxin-antitoxin,